MRYLFKHFANFLIELIIFFLLTCKISLYIVDTNFFQMCFANIFSLSAACLHSLNSVLHLTEIFNFNKAQVIRFFLLWIMLLMYLKSHCQTQGHISYIFFNSVTALHFTFKSL